MKLYRNSMVFGVVLLMLLAVSGCGGSSSGTDGGSSSGPGTGVVDPTSVDGGAAATSLSIQLADSAPKLASVKTLAQAPDAADAAGGIVTISAARTSIEQIELEQPDGRSCSDIAISLEGGSCIEESSVSQTMSSVDIPEDTSDANEIHFPGPFVVDLLAGTSTPSFDSVQIPSGIYHELQLKVVPLDPLSQLVPAGDPLLGNSLLIEGSYAVESQALQLFRIVLSIDHEIQFASDAGFAVSEAAQITTLLLSLDVNSWFDGIDVGACLASGAAAQDGDGVFIIDATAMADAACDLVSALKENIEASTSVDEVVDDSPDSSES